MITLLLIGSDNLPWCDLAPIPAEDGGFDEQGNLRICGEWQVPPEVEPPIAMELFLFDHPWTWTRLSEKKSPLSPERWRFYMKIRADRIVGHTLEGT